MGRAVLVNSVLDSQLSYIMSALQLPQGVLDAVDKRRRSFFWTGQEQAHGSQCLVAWEQTCQPKELGGLGIKKHCCPKQVPTAETVTPATQPRGLRVG